MCVITARTTCSASRDLIGDGLETAIRPGGGLGTDDENRVGQLAKHVQLAIENRAAADGEQGLLPSAHAPGSAAGENRRGRTRTVGHQIRRYQNSRR